MEDCQHDGNLINRNIWSSINKYWIFNFGQKSVVDGRECIPVQAEVQFLCLHWQVLISNYLHLPLTFPGIKTSQQRKHSHWRMAGGGICGCHDSLHISR